MHFRRFTVLALTVTFAHGHFILNHPVPIGFDDRRETERPCGSFDPAVPIQDPTPWSVAGSYIGTLTTHPHADWEFNYARAGAPAEFQSLTPPLMQMGVGSFCATGIRVPGAVGDVVMLQIVQNAHGETLYQVRAAAISLLRLISAMLAVGR